MMLPNDYPRSCPFVRIINRNPDYKVDPYYQQLQSKSDKSSFILNDKLNTCKNWHPSNSLVHFRSLRSTSSSNAMICSKLGSLFLNQSPKTSKEEVRTILGTPSIKITIITWEEASTTGVSQILKLLPMHGEQATKATGGTREIGAIKATGEIPEAGDKGHQLAVWGA